jgi:hypothetical protein
MHNNDFWSISYTFSLIICKVCTRRGKSGSWKSEPEKASSEYLFCTTPKDLKFHGEYFRNI